MLNCAIYWTVLKLEYQRIINSKQVAKLLGHTYLLSSFYRILRLSLLNQDCLSIFYEFAQDQLSFYYRISYIPQWCSYSYFLIISSSNFCLNHTSILFSISQLFPDFWFKSDFSFDNYIWDRMSLIYHPEVDKHRIFWL